MLDNAVRADVRVLQKPSDLLEVCPVAQKLRLHSDLCVVLLQRYLDRLTQRLHRSRVCGLEQLRERRARLRLHIVLQIDRL